VRTSAVSRKSTPNLHKMSTPSDQSQLAALRDALQQMQEAQAFASHDVDGLSKQVVQIQQQLQALSRRLSAIEARIVQRSMLPPIGESTENADDMPS
jgi:predicted  nucleic acid-binding Zn-ribbon protein